ncbi:unnamed protein product [Paramecium octaurelia]|uniref:Uncharacterized protein n=1 Tax=Paramecium octaurelia TaxID=43137 RepID=A0A8S1RZQ7_PAROT|nr:unnamed protein product [Paramecium octaurelia]
MDFMIEIKWTQFLGLCLVLSTNEDFISGSNDPGIKFWINKNEWMCQQTITEHSGFIFGLIISCGYDKLILIMKQQEENNEWVVIQKIKVGGLNIEYALLMIIFSHYDIEQLTAFEMNPINKQFNKTRDISIKCGLEDECFFLNNIQIQSIFY